MKAFSVDFTNNVANIYYILFAQVVIHDSWDYAE